MKKVINGVMYNTLTAANKATIYSDEECCVTLYQKESGEYFLAGDGGTISFYYDVFRKGGWSNDECIIPVTEAEARSVVEELCDGDTYVKIFGVIEE